MNNDFPGMLEVHYSEDGSKKELVGMMSKEVGRFVREKLGTLEKDIFDKDTIPSEIIKEYFNKGYASTSLPGDLGGADFPYVFNTLNLFLTAEECASLAVMASVRNTAFQTVLMGKNEEHRDNYIKKTVENHKYAAFALTEPNHGTDATRMDLDTKAVTDGNHYVINGTKQFITSSDKEMTEFYVVFANVKGKGTTPIIVDGKSEGIKIRHWTKDDGKMGLFGSRTAELYLDDVRVPKGNRVGEEGCGNKYTRNLNAGRLDMATIATALAVSAQKKAIRKTAGQNARTQFGKKIGDYQALSNKIAENQEYLESMMSLVLHTALLKDAMPDHFPEAAARVKTYATEKAIHCIRSATDVHGGETFMEYSYNRELRDIFALTRTEGATVPLRGLQYHLMTKYLRNE